MELYHCIIMMESCFSYFNFPKLINVKLWTCIACYGLCFWWIGRRDWTWRRDWTFNGRKLDLYSFSLISCIWKLYRSQICFIGQLISNNYFIFGITKLILILFVNQNNCNYIASFQIHNSYYYFTFDILFILINIVFINPWPTYYACVISFLNFLFLDHTYLPLILITKYYFQTQFPNMYTTC